MAALLWQTSEEDLERAFRKEGEVEKVNIVRDPTTNVSRWVGMGLPGHARRAQGENEGVM